jgi:hypothetical protein
MKRLKWKCVFLAGFLTLCPLLTAQEAGYWRALGSTARSITGDVALSSEKISINLSTNYWMAQIRALTPAELSAVFGVDLSAPGTGSLYRLNIPGNKRFAHKNTLCGGEDVKWMATQTDGRTLQIAFFSSSHVPVLTQDALSNSDSTALCGVFQYQH